MRWLILRCLSHGNPECHKLHFCPVQRKNKSLVITGLVPVTPGYLGWYLGSGSISFPTPLNRLRQFRGHVKHNPINPLHFSKFARSDPG